MNAHPCSFLVSFNSTLVINVVLKRIFMMESMPNVILALINSITKLIDCRSEPGEHEFGMLRQRIRGLTINQLIILLGVVKRRSAIMPEHNWVRRIEDQKGHKETSPDYFISSTYQQASAVPQKVDFNSTIPVVEQNFDHLKGVMAEGHEMIYPLLDLFDVVPDRKSPFFKLFPILKDLTKDHFRYTPYAIPSSNSVAERSFDSIE